MITLLDKHYLFNSKNDEVINYDVEYFITNEKIIVFYRISI